MAEYQRKKTGRMVPCPGEAHQNAFIDHCMLCAPGWGEVPEYEPVDLERARAKRLDVPARILTSEQYGAAQGLVKSGVARWSDRHRRVRGGRVSYVVLEWEARVA